jgi:hypothetical protein
MRHLSEDEAMRMSGVGHVGAVIEGSDGMLYEWVEGIDGLGNPVGLWKRLRRLARPLVRRALPFAQKIAPFIPGGAAALTAAVPILQQAGVAGYGGLGALYQAPDGTVYQMQGLSEEDDLRGFLADEELHGLEEDEELRGLDEDEELRGLEDDEELRGFEDDEELRGLNEEEALRGFADDPDLQGFAAEDELRGFAEDDPLQGLEQGYVRQDGINGIEAYVPQQAPATRWFASPAQAPELWKPLW